MPMPSRSVLACALLAAPAGVLAQSTAPVTLDRVQVSATRRPQPAHATPAAVAVVDLGDERDTLGANLAEAVPGVPGLLARSRQNHAQDEQLSIRGFGTRASFGIRGVRLYVDGIPATMPDGQGQVSHFPLFAAERIEVLRGPFSALYGNAAGGVIQVFTHDGTAPREWRATLTGGSDGNRRASAGLRDAHGRIDYAVGLNHFATDGYRDHSRAERHLFHGKLNARRGDTRLTVLANAFDSPQAQDPLGLTRAQFQADPRQATAAAALFDTRKSVAQHQLGAVLTHGRDGGAQLRVLGYAGERHITQFLSIPVVTQANPLSGGGVIDLRAPYGGVDARWTAPLHLAGRPLELVVGASVERQRQDRHGYENFVGERLGVRGALRLDQDDRVRGVDQYAQATWAVAPDWSLAAGVCRSEVAFRSRDRYVTAANPDDSGRVRYRATSPVLGARWQATPAWSAFASWGRGFETPTFNELGYRADGGSGLNFALRAARTRSAEAGLRHRGGRVASELVLFRADTRDELTVNTSSGGRTTYRNAGRARREGAEWSADLTLTRALRAQVALTWLDARFRDGFLACTGTPCTQPTVPVAPGTRIPGVPRGLAYAALRWGDGPRGWHARVDGQYVGDMPVNHRDDERAPAYAVVGASGGYGFERRHGGGRVFLAIDNLFDRRYAGSVIVNDGNRRYYEPAPGRSVTAGVEWRWRD